MRFIEEALRSSTDDCIDWPFAKDKDGYGKVGRRGRAHRIVLEAASGPPPTPAHEAAHESVICHNPSCVNPRHLRWATVRENSHDRFTDGTDPRGERDGNAKLNWDDVRAMRASLSAGEKAARLAERYSVSIQNVRLIAAGRTWREALHVEAPRSSIR